MWALPVQQILAVLDALCISLPQGPHKEAKTGPAEAGVGSCWEGLALSSAYSLSIKPLPTHR